MVEGTDQLAWTAEHCSREYVLRRHLRTVEARPVASRPVSSSPSLAFAFVAAVGGAPLSLHRRLCDVCRARQLKRHSR